MIECDLIGFHLFEYAKNFLTTCMKLLNIPYEYINGRSLGINYKDRNVMLRIGHVGIEKQYIDEVLTSQEFSKFYYSTL
jgi:trehalose 6-phosphate synthase/phosphatase